MSSRQFIEEIAKRLDAKDRNSIVISAHENGVPIFCPAIADSSIGIAAALAERRVVIDTIRDVEELLNSLRVLKNRSDLLCGGVPKNFIQQTEVVARLKGYNAGGHEYAIQITTDTPQFGGLSGCTFEEGVSWGKISHRGKKVQVNVDATIAFTGSRAAEREEEKLSGFRLG